MASQKPIIQISQLKKQYRDFTAVNDISFKVCEGVIMYILAARTFKWQ